MRLWIKVKASECICRLFLSGLGSGLGSCRLLLPIYMHQKIRHELHGWTSTAITNAPLVSVVVGKSFWTVADGFTFVPLLLAAFLFPQAGRAGLEDLPPAPRLPGGAGLSGNGLAVPLGVLALGFA